MIPSGFTPITTDYNPIVPVPSISSLEKEGVEIINNSVLIPGEIVQVASGSITPYSSSSSTVSIAASISKAYIRPGDSFTISGVVSSSALETLKGSVIARLLPTPNNSVVNLQEKAFVGTISSLGKVTIAGSLGFNTQAGVKLQFVLHLPTTTVIPNLYVTAEELQRLGVYSNLVSVTTIASTNTAANSVQYKNPPTPEGVPLIPIHDVVVTTATYVFKTYVLDQEIDLAPTNQSPRGSSGNGIYSDLNLPSPLNTGLHNRSPVEAIQNLLGSSLNELERIKSWATEILGKAHSIASGLENSELAVIRNIVPDELVPALERYQSVIDEAGQYAADTAETYLSDYAEGNVVAKTNAVEQHNVGQYRLQTASAYTVNSPSIALSSQQTVIQSRFEHHASDVYQGSHIHYWIRAEDQYTCITNTAARYNQTDLAEYSANATYAAGNLTHYADTEWSQVGQAKPPLHPTNSRSLGTMYGNSVKLVQDTLKTKTILGKIVFSAGTDFSTSATNLISFHSNKFSSHTTLGDTNISSAKSVNVRAQTKASFSSSGITSMDGSMVFINCRKSRYTAPSAPVILNELPRTFDNMVDIAEYPRSAPVLPGPRGSRGGKTPEPGATPTDTGVGGWLTRHASPGS